MSEPPPVNAPLPPGSLVVADLHLPPTGGARTQSFVLWCDSLEAVPRLVLLGDVFDVWVGPRQMLLEGSPPVAEALERLVARGTAVDVVPGNRDILLGAEFERASGARLCRGGILAVRPDARPVLLVHGDEFCTRDQGYQRLRRIMRSRPFWLTSRVAPLWFARWIGRRLRHASDDAKPRKPDLEKSIQPDAVRRAAAAYGAELVVCGHAHDPRDERLEGGPRWIVLGAYGDPDGRDVLVFSESGAAELRSSGAAKAGAAKAGAAKG